MLQFEVSVLPLLAIAVVNFFLSWIWYSPLLFMKPWTKALGTYGKVGMSEAEKKAMPFLFLSGLVTSLLLSYGLQIVVHSVGAKDFFGGLLVGVVLWAAFALTHSLSTLGEGRNPIVLLIKKVLYLLTDAIVGGRVAGLP